VRAVRLRGCSLSKPFFERFSTLGMSMSTRKTNEDSAARKRAHVARKKTAAETAVTVAKVPQAHGGALNAGGSPGNRGGGRKRNEFKARLEQIRDEKALHLLEAILGGSLPQATCEHCGRESSTSLGDLVPTVDARLRAAEMSMKYTIGVTKTIKLDGVRGVAEAFELIRSRIRHSLAPEAAERLINDISEDLRAVR
jgi:hypothetical protein